MPAQQNGTTNNPAMKNTHTGIKPERKKISSASLTEIENARKQKPAVNVQRSIELLSQRETNVTNKSAHKEKLKPYKMLRLTMGLCALTIAALVYEDVANHEENKEFRYPGVVVGLIAALGVARYGMHTEKRQLIDEQLRRMRKEEWDSNPTPEQAWTKLKANTR